MSNQKTLYIISFFATFIIAANEKQFPFVWFIIFVSLTRNANYRGHITGENAKKDSVSDITSIPNTFDAEISSCALAFHI